MDSHFVGQGRNLDGTSSARGSSLAVRQFVDLASHWVAVHSPVAPFAVLSVTVDEMYCLGCFDVRNFDVITGKAGEKAEFCRCCGKEHRHE